MELVREALLAIQREPKRAGAILDKAITPECREIVLEGLGGFVASALHGVVIDPDKL